MSDVSRGLRHPASGAMLVQTLSGDQPLPPVPVGWVEMPVSEAMGVLDANEKALRREYETTHAEAVAEQARLRAIRDAERHAATQRIADKLGVDVKDVETVMAGRP